MSIEIRNLSYVFSRWGQNITALNQINLQIPDGQYLVLTGPNGSGKTTLLDILAGGKNDFSGDVFIGGRPIKSMKRSEIAQQVFHMPQNPILGTSPLLTVFENMLIADGETPSQKGAGRKRPSRKALEKKYEAMLNPFGGEVRLHQLVKTLSGGQRQLLSLVIASLRPSGILLLDEPTASLDPGRSQYALDIISKVHQTGKTVIMVTHDKHLAMSLGDRTVGLRNGTIVYDKKSGERTIENLDSVWW